MMFKIEYFNPFVGRLSQIHTIYMFGDIDSVIKRFKLTNNPEFKIVSIEAVD